MIETREKIDASQLDLKDTVVNISRVTKVVKGGKNLSFSALVVVGDGHGVVGFGVGKAKEVPSAIKKGIEAAKKSLIRVPLQGTTVPHPVLGRFGAGQVLLKPAPDGTGIIAGGAVRAVVESAGIQNVLTKSIGSANSHNVVRATFTGLQSCASRRRCAVCAARKKSRRQRRRSRRANGLWPRQRRQQDADGKRVKITLGQEHHRLQQEPGEGGRGHGPAPHRPQRGAAPTPTATRGMILKVRHLVTSSSPQSGCGPRPDATTGMRAES